MVNLGRLNLEGEDAVGSGGKNCGEGGSGWVKAPILGDGRSRVAFRRCIAAGSSNMRRSGGLLKLAGAKVTTE